LTCENSGIIATHNEKLNSHDARLGRMEVKVENIDRSLIENNVVTRQLATTLVDINETLKTNNDTMISMKMNLDFTNKRFDNVDEHLAKLTDKVRKVDDKGKIDLVVEGRNAFSNHIQNHWWKYVLGIAGSGGVILEALQILEKF